MPTYGYRCPECSLEFDLWQRMTDEAAAACPSCGAAAQRLFFPAGIVFKGSGFYKTDSRAASSASTTPSSTPSSDDGSSRKSGDSKAAEPAPAKKRDGDTKNATGSAPATSD